MTSVHAPASALGRSTIRRLLLSIGLTALFVLVEAGAGLLANSLVLLTDAAHNVTDVLSLILTWWAFRITSRSANSGKTYGYHRAGILVALVNSTTLVVIALGIFYEAYRRLIAPPPVNANVLIGVGSLAVLVNLATALLVRRGSREDLNLRSAYLHLVGDVLSTLGAVAAGIVIRFTGMNWLDPLVSLLIGLLILWNGWTIVRESVNILMEGTPVDLNVDAVIAAILQVEGVRGVHDLHIWSITRGMRTLSAHLLTDDIPISQGAQVQIAVRQILDHQFGIAHSTLQLECAGSDPSDLYCNITVDNHRN